MGRRLGIVGSRHYPSKDIVTSFVQDLPMDTTVVSGGAIGVDTWAVEAAQTRGLSTQVFHADWSTHGRSAGPIRNAEIVKNVDEVVAFWDGESGGAANTIKQATEAGVSVRLFDQAGCPLKPELALMRANRGRRVC